MKNEEITKVEIIKIIEDEAMKFSSIASSLQKQANSIRRKITKEKNDSLKIIIDQIPILRDQVVIFCMKKYFVGNSFIKTQFEFSGYFFYLSNLKEKKFYISNKSYGGFYSDLKYEISRSLEMSTNDFKLPVYSMNNIKNYLDFYRKIVIENNREPKHEISLEQFYINFKQYKVDISYENFKKISKVNISEEDFNKKIQELIDADKIKLAMKLLNKKA